MKYIITSFLALFILFGQQVSAQDAVKGKEILAKLSKKYKAMKSIKAGFKYTIEMPRDKFKEETNGIIYLNGSKFRLEMAEQNIICDGSKMWTHLPDDNSVQITKYDPKALGINPAEIFTMYEKGFLSAYMGDEGTNQLIELTPTDKTKPMFKIKLFIDKVKNQITKSKVYEKNGNIYTYDILNFSANPNLASNTFEFDKSKYPKIIVTDLTTKK